MEAQYIKAAKNISSIFVGFGYTYHAENTGILPTRSPCRWTSASIRPRRCRCGGDMEKVRDHTFTQVTAMLADVRGSMMLPVVVKPTRNLQARRSYPRA